MITAMQDLRNDLILTQTSAKESLLEIENQEIRKACQEVVRLTLNNIIKRIDDELLELEKQQIIEFTSDFIDEYTYGDYDGNVQKSKTIEEYYNEKFNK